MVVDFRRYFSSMNCSGAASGNANKNCDDRFTAGGAVDQYIGVRPGLACTMGGRRRAVEEAEAAAAPAQAQAQEGLGRRGAGARQVATAGRRVARRAAPARHHPRGHGRVLRVRGAARQPGAARPARHRRRRRAAAASCWRRRTRCGRSGVRSAMPMARALKLAPDAVVVPPRHDAYAEASEQVFDILALGDAAGGAAVARRGVPGRDGVGAAVRRARGHRRRASARRSPRSWGCRRRRASRR